MQFRGNGRWSFSAGRIEREGGAPFAQDRCQFDAAAEHPGKFARDGQAQAAAGVVAGDRAIELAEFFEDDFLVVSGNARPSIGDGDADGLNLGGGQGEGAARGLESSESSGLRRYQAGRRSRCIVLPMRAPAGLRCGR